MATGNVVEELKDGVLSSLVNTTRTAGQISNEDLAFHRSSNPSITPLLERQSSRLLQLVQGLTRSATSGTEIIAPQLPDTDSVEDDWERLVDVFDNLLEKADACLDEYTGSVRRLSPNQEERIKTATSSAERRRPDRAYRTLNITKPQLLFDTVPKNDERTPFKPLLRSKPHAITPLEESLVLAPSSTGSQQYKNPYEKEILESQYPAETFAKADPVPPMPYANTKATFVDTPETLMSMIEELKGAREIAVDLEHHDEHSYIGLVSLMQISTRDKDWIVDTLKPWRQRLQGLNDVFTDPKILKVFHGASMDMIWLQRDFGIYVVGLFDTYHASRCLGYPRNSLAYLLKRFVDFDAAKQYQMADWRVRPLPEEMFNYARSDTHFLLYIYDNMRNELIDKSNISLADGDLISVVMNSSKGQSLQRYERPLYDRQQGAGAMGWYNLLCRTPALFNREQFAVFRAVHQWRDTVARSEDESVHIIMSKQVLYNIAREMPTDMPSLLGCSHPMSKCFQERKGDLLRLIKQARTEGKTGPEMKELLGSIQPNGVEHNKSSTESKQGAPTPLFAVHKSVLSDSPMKNSSSMFWGSIVLNGRMAHNQRSQSHDENLRLALPFPPLTGQAYQDAKSADDAGVAIRESGYGTESKYQRMGERNPKQGVFILKQTGSSRKRSSSKLQELDKPISATLSNHGSGSMDAAAKDKDISSAVASGDSQSEPCEKKRLKRVKKQERRVGDSSATGDGTLALEMGDTEALDYKKAPSVLHARRSVKEAQSRGGRAAENPYLKSMDAPKGLRKTKNEGDGNKSLTFRS